MTKTKKYQICVAGEHVMEFNEIGEDYMPRNWHIFDDLKSLESFLKSKKNKPSLMDDLRIVCITQDQTNKIIHIGMAPNIEGAPVPEEHVFNSREDAEDYIQKNNLLASSNLLDEDSKIQIEKFFRNEKCFFPGARELHQEFDQKQSEINPEDQEALAILAREYEQKIVNILIQL